MFREDVPFQAALLLRWSIVRYTTGHDLRSLMYGFCVYRLLHHNMPLLFSIPTCAELDWITESRRNRGGHRPNLTSSRTIAGPDWAELRHSETPPASWTMRGYEVSMKSNKRLQLAFHCCFTRCRWWCAAVCPASWTGWAVCLPLRWFTDGGSSKSRRWKTYWSFKGGVKADIFQLVHWQWLQGIKTYGGKWLRAHSQRPPLAARSRSVGDSPTTSSNGRAPTTAALSGIRLQPATQQDTPTTGHAHAMGAIGRF